MTSFLAPNYDYLKLFHGFEEWSKRLLEEDCSRDHHIYYAQETDDANYVAIGSAVFGDSHSLYMTKRDNNGDEIWTTYRHNGFYDDSSLKQTSDGGYIVCGRVWSNNGDLFIGKFNSDGNDEWSKIYGGNYTEHATSIQETYEGGFILVGPYGYGLMKVDSNGNIEWNNDELTGNEVDLTSDGGFIVTGGYLVKTDSQGNIEWTYSESCNSGTPTIDGGYACTGPAPGNNIGLYKIDSSGNEEWVQTYGHPDVSANGKSMQQTNDGGYIILAQEGINYIIIKTDSEGNTVAWPE